MIPLRPLRVLIVFLAVSASMMLVDELTRVAGLPDSLRLPISGIAAGGVVFLLAYRAGTLLRFSVAKRSTDPTLLSRVQSIIGVVRSVEREMPGLVMVESPKLFAFTVNDGRHCCIVLSRGMVEPMNNTELSGLIAHECGHIIENHPKLVAVVLGMLASVKFSVGVTLPAAIAALLAYLMMVRRWEFAADIEAAKMVGPTALLAAFNRYMDMSGEKPLSQCVELFCAHPSMERRIHVLQHFARSEANPEGITK